MIKKQTLLLLSVLLSLFACNKTKDLQEANGKENMKTEIVRNGVKIDHEICGNGDLTVLFIHGWCINQTYWAHQFSEFCDEYKLVSIDLPGFGNSGKNRNTWTIEEYALDVKAVIDQLQLENVILVGHSMAGDIILEVGLNSDNVIALVGIDNFKELSFKEDKVVDAEIENFMNMLKQDFVNVVPVLAENSLFHPDTDTTVKKRVIEDYKNSNQEIAIATLEKLFVYAKKETKKLPLLKKKLYLINTDSPPTNVSSLKLTGVAFELLEIPSSGHYPMVEQPEKFNEALRKVLEQLISDS